MRRSRTAAHFCDHHVLEMLMPAPGPTTNAPPVNGIPPGRPFSWRFVTPLFVGSALNPINSSLIATALVPIAHGLGVSIGRTAALVTALYLASAIAQPTAGKAAEVFGPRRVFLAGIGLVIVGGLMGGAAHSLPTLLISRVLLGLGTSCAYPTAMLLIRRRAEDAGLDKPPGGVLGGLQIAGIATASLGLPLGGVLVAVLGWRSVFFINVPVALVALVTTLAWVPPDSRPDSRPDSPSDSRPDSPPDRSRRARDVAAGLDVIGIAGFAAAMIALLLFLFALPDARWYLLAISAVLWIALVLWELRARTPFLDLRLLAGNRALTSTYLRYGLVLFCAYVVLYGVTQWAQSVRGLSETEAGLLLLPMTLVSGLVISLVSRRNRVRGPVVAAALACLIGSAGVLLLSASGWIGWVVVVTLVFGVAMGTSGAGNQIALYDHAPAEQLGTASGLLRTFGYLGSIAASATTGIVFRIRVSDPGMHLIAWIMVGVGVVLVLTTLADRTLRTRPAP
ncbi:MFS transporter [Kitasatospora sp. NPDC059811]|uniref:MFS transporter n=1 Tax=Streptomycetaceae TaxID=2062 RepID=UPI001FCB702F|nr:MFS transporter [Streptomyces sp. MJM8645]